MSHLSSHERSTPGPVESIFQLKFFYLNLGSTPCPAPVPSMSHLRSCGEGVNSGSGSSSRSIVGLSLFDLNLGSNPSPAPVPSMFHLKSCGRGSTLDLDPAPDPNLGCTFDLNFHCIDNMLTISFLQISIFCPISLFQVVRFEQFLYMQGSLFQIIILSTNNPILSLKLNVLSLISILSGWN